MDRCLEDVEHLSKNKLPRYGVVNVGQERSEERWTVSNYLATSDPFSDNYGHVLLYRYIEWPLMLLLRGNTIQETEESQPVLHRI